MKTIHAQVNEQMREIKKIDKALARTFGYETRRVKATQLVLENLLIAIVILEERIKDLTKMNDNLLKDRVE